DAVAGHPRLGDLEDGRADAVAVSDADLVVARPLDGEVLAELPVHEVVPPELALPVAVRVELVDEDRSLLPAVPGHVALAVAVDVEPAHPARAADGVLEHAGEDARSSPGHGSRHADVQRDERSHLHEGGTGASSTSWIPPTSSTLRLRSGPCAITV